MPAGTNNRLIRPECSGDSGYRGHNRGTRVSVAEIIR